LSETQSFYAPALAGWECILYGPFAWHWGSLAWFSNICFLFGLAYFAKSKFVIASVLLGTGLILTQSVWLLKGEMIKVGPGGVSEIISGVGVGYFLWLLALLTPFIFSTFQVLCSYFSLAKQ